MSADYTYDELNRLTEVKKNGTVAGVYQYNGDGLLVEKTQDGVKTRYYYDGGQIIAEGIVNSDGTISLKARYFRGNELVYREGATGAKGNYLHNGHGDVAVVGIFQFESWYA
jgi:YD repeat-containing protein